MFLNIRIESTKSKKRLYIALHLKPTDMKYNVVKVLNYPSGSNTIEILSNVEFQQAIQELESQNEHQKCEMFQDVSNVNYTLDLPSFVCVKNGMTIIYQLEVNYFETIAEEIKPSHLKQKKVYFPTHQLN